MKRVLAAAVVTALGIRVVRSRHRRFLHPDGRSFSGELEVTGTGEATGAALIDEARRHPVTLRLSKGVGTRPGRADILGLAVRVHGPVCGHKRDLLFSTAGRGRRTRHLPVPRRSFDTWYGTIFAYRTTGRRKLYLSAAADPGGHPLGRTLESVVAAAEHDGARLILAADDRPFGVVRFGDALPAEMDRALAFDPIRNAAPDLYPTGAIHGVRALAYRLSQLWRGARPAPADLGTVARTAAHL